MRRAHGIPATMLCAALLCPVVTGSARLAAQAPDTAANTVSAMPHGISGVRVDTLAFRGPTKDAGTAMLLSAILPGAGQAYNESYWKVPVVVGLGGYFLVEFFDNNSKYRDYSDMYEASLDTTPGGDPDLLTYREFYRDQRDTFAWYFLILYAVNILDAYVDASLFDFDVGTDLARGAHGPPAPGAALTLRLRF